MIRLLYLMFVLSGAAGLMYESVWTRYLGLFVGHDAYAQIVVLLMFLGGMSLGALLVSRISERIVQPLYGYALIELIVGAIGLVFHDGFQAITAWAYQSIYPSLAGTIGLPIVKWSIAGGFLLPQSVLLGATFPLMSAGVLRLAPERPGNVLSLLYFANSLGAAAGVLIAGFYLRALVGLPGTLMVAAGLNVAVAVGAFYVGRRAASRRSAEPTAPVPAPVAAVSNTESTSSNLALRRLLLCTSFGTAAASFIYEIDWIRMLSLVLGSATRSFELMLSAFILGLALGAFWIRSRADRFAQPIVALGAVQWIMGLLALATLFFYSASFEWIATLMRTFAENDAGYAGFTVAKYALCLAIMLPATFCAGMTLPLITRVLMTSGLGERAIGAVYGWNTLGSIVGVVVGGLVLLPVFGLKGMLIIGALLDMGIGLVLMARRPRLAWAVGVATVAIIAGTIAAPALDPVILASGVFRTGVGTPEDREARFHTDGRTSTVTGYLDSDLMVLSTNGKPDASLGPIWFRTCADVPQPRPLLYDGATQALMPLVAQAHAPRAQSIAMIGHGSGMSSHFSLGSPALRELVTIEIEPQMVTGSRIFYPANARAFDDPRATMVIDDAKSYFASARRRFDLIMSAPSNAWVSGVSGLFTTEFYERVRHYMADTGIFAQWLQVYELDDELVLTVLAAIHKNFPSYEIYLIPRGDLLIVASNQPSVPKPDWSVAAVPELRRDFCRFIPPTPATFDALHLVSRQELAPLLDHYTAVNSDFYPILDLGAERRRFRGDYANGIAALSSTWFNLLSSVRGRVTEPLPDTMPTFPENPRLRARAIATYLRTPADEVLGSMIGAAAEQAQYQWETWQEKLAADRAPLSWPMWIDQAGAVQQLREGGTAGWADEELHAAMLRFLDRHNAPAEARDVVAFRYALAKWNFADAAAAADRLWPLVVDGETWIDTDEYREGAVFAKLHTGDVAGAREVLKAFRYSGNRGMDDLRSQLVESYVTAAEQGRKIMAARTTRP